VYAGTQKRRFRCLDWLFLQWFLSSPTSWQAPRRPTRHPVPSSLRSEKQQSGIALVKVKDDLSKKYMSMNDFQDANDAIMNPWANDMFA
jgi:hypothetical protein